MAVEADKAEKVVNPLASLQGLPEALQLVESVMMQNSHMPDLLRYRGMWPLAQVLALLHVAFLVCWLGRPILL